MEKIRRKIQQPCAALRLHGFAECAESAGDRAQARLAIRHHVDVVLRVAALAQAGGAIRHAALAGSPLHRPVALRRTMQPTISRFPPVAWSRSERRSQFRQPAVSWRLQRLIFCVRGANFPAHLRIARRPDWLSTRFTISRRKRWPTGIAAGRYLLVDVREPNEVAAEAYPPAVLVPIVASSIPPTFLIPPGAKWFLPAVPGRRSVTASLAAQEAGLAYDKHLAGGILAWKQAGLPTES